jgi:hypothetical protein
MKFGFVTSHTKLRCMDEIKVKTQLSLSDFIKLQYYLLYSTGWTIYITLLGLVVLLGSLFAFSGASDIENKDKPYIALIFGVFVVVLIPLGLFFSAKRIYASHKMLQEPMYYTFSPSGIHVEGSSFSSTVSWEKMYKIKRMSKWLLIYHGKNIANCVKLPDFEGDSYSRFVSLVKSLHPRVKAKL